MQPNLQTAFQVMTNQQENTAITKGGSLKGNIEQKGMDGCFLGMLDKIESIPDENIIDLKKLQGKSQRNDNMLGMIVKTEHEIHSMISDMTLKEVNLSEILLGAEQNKKGNEENQSNSKTAGQAFLKGKISDNVKDSILFGNSGNTEVEKSAIDQNTMATTSKTESDYYTKKSVLSKTLNIFVKTKENESKTGQGELNKNNAGVQASKGSKKDSGKNAGAQLLKGLETDIAKTVKISEAKGSGADVRIKHDADVKHVEKTAATDRILMERATVRAGVEESKIFNSPHIFKDEIKDNELSKKELLLKMSTGIKEREPGSDSLKNENTSDEKTLQSNKEFNYLREAGLKIKGPGSEFSAGKIHHMESESKDNGIILPKNLSVDKSPEEIMPGREDRLTSNISRASTFNQIVEKAALNLKNGKSQIRIDLKPEYLGSVRMKIITKNHLVTVRILTELPVVKEMIENHIGQLKIDLQSHGLEIDTIDVSVENDSQQRDKGFEKAGFMSEKENSNAQDNKGVPPEETKTAKSLRESTTENGLDFFA